MNFLIKLWHVISTIAVVLPKVWPVLKILVQKGFDLFLKRKVEEKRLEELKEAAKKAEETQDSSSFEEKFGTGSAVGDSSVVVQSAVAVEPVTTEPEKKSPELASQPPSESTGLTKSSLLETTGKIAAAGIALYVLNALISRKEAKAAVMGFGSSTSSVIIDGSGTIKNYSVYRGGFRCGSKLLP